MFLWCHAGCSSLGGNKWNCEIRVLNALAENLKGDINMSDKDDDNKETNCHSSGSIRLIVEMKMKKALKSL